MNDSQPTPQDPINGVEEGEKTPKKEARLLPISRSGGCLLVLGLVLIIAAGIAYQWALNSGLEKLPLKIESVSPTPEERIRLKDAWQAAQSAKDLVLSTSDWSLLMVIIIEDAITKEGLLPGSSISLSTSPEDLLDLRLSLGFPEEGRAPPPYAGRFINIQGTGNIAIEDGEITRFEAVYYRWGSVFDTENLSGETGIEVGSRLLAILEDLVFDINLTTLERIPEDRIRITWE